MGTLYAELGRRERQIMDVLFRRGHATASEVLSELSDPPSYSSVRGMLRLLETKGHVRHRWEGPRHVFFPVQSAEQVQKKAARHVLHTFFNNSMEAAVAAMLGGAQKPASEEELDRLAKLVERARRNGGRP
ncbi:MAG TPA: BlaI/MecI/CopY family transcriptional regulator [Candidatus Sulfotelmatobacter sp.]|nr:BlaI/MecI/CopY family transcriptional regulator [Candidatus Sulfotelmatobacter sp.]